MTEEDRSVPLTRLPAAIWILMAVGTALPAVAFGLIRGWSTLGDLDAVTLAWLAGLTLVHEGTHAAAWKWASGLPWSAFSFGFSWKALTPYCHAREAMPVRAYRIGSLAPLVITGVLPWFAAVATGDGSLGVASSVLIGGAAGDVWVFFRIRDLDDRALVRDHPENAGCVVLRPD